MADRIFVALDLETTGLKAQKDAIIEIGAVRFQGDRILDRFATLVNPRRPLPRFIQQLTGIREEDVAQAPPLEAVLPELLAFVDRDVFGIVAHNAPFDIGFLKVAGVNFHRPVLDTFELATILMPGVPSYNLGELSRALQIDLTDAHRALDDAQATARLFMHLLRELRAQPLAVLEEIVARGQDVAWPFLPLFQDALLAARAQRGQLPGHHRTLTFPGASFQAAPPLQAQEEPRPLDEDAVTRFFNPDGPLARRLAPHYERRTGQVEMARLVLDALNRGDHRLIEAGTGTGKSLAYLVPAALWSLANGQRVVIATHTIALQDQLIHKDIPQLQAALAEMGQDTPLRARVLKGRGRYLCTRRLHSWATSHKLSPLELRVLAKVLVWLPTTETGDVGELTLREPGERAIWEQIASDPATCSLERCGLGSQSPHRDFFLEAREQAESAHLLIVNHALLLADVAAGGRVLPPYDHLIVDEAHHLEEAATGQLTYRANRQLMEAMLSQLQFGGELLALLSHRPRWREMADQLREQVQRIRKPLGHFYDALLRLAVSQQNIRGKADYLQRLALDDGVRAQPRWSQMEVEWERISGLLSQATALLQELVAELEQAQWWQQEPQAGYLADLQGLAGHLTELTQQMDAIIYAPVGSQNEHISWLEVRASQGEVSLCTAPLHVNDLLAQKLLHPRRSVILTGATLRTGDGFRFMRDRLGAWDVTVSAIDSPFDYQANALLYMPSDMPMPNHPDYQSAVERAILEAARGAEGRTLALFTSYAQLRKTAEAIQGPLNRLGIKLLKQGGGSRHRLLREFQESERAVLLGTGTFWEGLDLPGDALSCLLIVRLPFAVPNDPINTARRALYEDAFAEYSVPDAVLRFRQGFGRLIRRATDRGVVVLLDSRIWRKSYGEAFLEALPACTRRHGPLMNLAESVRDWLSNEPWVVR